MHTDFVPTTHRKISPFVPPYQLRLRGDTESERNPMLSFEFVRLLFKFNAQTPAFDELFQLPPEIGANISRYFPYYIFVFSSNPSTNHLTNSINLSTYCHISMNRISFLFCYFSTIFKRKVTKAIC